MKKLILLSVMFLFAVPANTQELAINFNQNGYMYSGIAYVESNTYALQSPNGQVCGFSASFEVLGNNTIKMYVFNPTLNGYIPATYYLYESGECEVYVQGYVFNGNWHVKESGSATRGGNVSFRGKTHGDGNPPHSGSDGYIYMGTSIKYSGNSYRLYKKEGHKYIYDRVDGWIRLD